MKYHTLFSSAAVVIGALRVNVVNINQRCMVFSCRFCTIHFVEYLRTVSTFFFKMNVYRDHLVKLLDLDVFCRFYFHTVITVLISSLLHSPGHKYCYHRGKKENKDIFNLK